MELHEKSRGKIEIRSKVPLQTRQDLTLAYTPGVAEPCRMIHGNAELAYKYTSKWNLVAVVSDGTAVLGLGDIGPEAGLPVMEGKALLFKEFGGVDGFPICVRTKDVGEIVDLVKKIEPTFGGINLEDISAPRCFEIEARLKEELSIPVFHDDQHGTAIVVLSALTNALKVVGKRMESVRIVISGAGAAGMATGNFLLKAGAGDVILCDTHGAIFDGRTGGMNPYKAEFARRSNRKKIGGSLADAMKGADVFVGVSAPGIVTREMVASMAPKAVVIAMANPVPEIMPDEAKAGGAMVVGTGRSDFPNQINNVLAFPGVFRGALDVRAKSISEGMKLAAANAIAAMVPADKLSADYIIPPALDRNVARQVAEAVAEQAKKEGLAREWPA